MKKIAMICMACATAFCLAACGVHNVSAGQAEGEAYDAVISVKGREEAPQDGAGTGKAEEVFSENAGTGSGLSFDAGDEAAKELLKNELSGLTKLVGKDDETAAGLLGGGRENWTEDGAVLVGRNYRTELFGRECSVYTSYDEAALVSVVVAELPGQDAEGYSAMLTALFGEAAVFEDEETGEVSRYWESGGYRFTLYEFEDAVSLDVNWAFFQQ